MKGERKEYIDLYRGIGVILMIMGHMKFLYAQDGTGQMVFEAFDHYIHAFHMPMFFFLSGFCHKKSDVSLWTVVVKQAKKLLIPYFGFGIIQYVMWRLYIGDSIKPLINLFWINTDGLAIAGAIWFLTALFFVIILYAFIERFVDSEFVQSVIVVIVSLIGCLFSRIASYRLPYAIDVAFVGLGFYYLGYVLEKYKDKRAIDRILNPRIVELVILSIINICLIMYNSSVNMRTAKYDFIPLFWFNAVLAIIIGMGLCRMICDKLSDSVFQNCIKGISEIGINGLIYVCINQLIITITARILEKVIVSSMLYNILLVIITFIVLRLAVVAKNRLRKKKI
ncbi:MAG: acyltransferase family protein [Lachnospiraceae bacterium]|nr:acyltransferase family protein [Lachnospiraceae bacterium]